ncbi:hypothetical protein [Methanoculleus sp. 7T]|nr:hypothetical protein [Methanoculleus sp. 7T]MCK8517376.1 hypothetical protein [Methanoculleus sp. 7T]
MLRTLLDATVRQEPFSSSDAPEKTGAVCPLRLLKKRISPVPMPQTPA